MHRSKLLPPITVFTASEPDTPLGMLWVAVTEEGLWALEFGIPRREFLERVQQRGRVQVAGKTPEAAGVLVKVRDYLLGAQAVVDFSIDWRGMTEFQVRVRRAVMAIPPGRTAGYGQIATQVGRPGAARAVGRVNATNPIPLVIPCHRVLGADGSLTGYGGAGGLRTKQWLLELERSCYLNHPSTIS